jgi:hypothetical protein
MTEIFLGGEAVKAGRVTRHELRQRYTTVYRGVYAPKNAELSLRDRAIAAWLASGRRGVIAGLVASALHGASSVDPAQPIEVMGVKRQPQEGLLFRTEQVADDEITRLAGLPVTTRIRTAFDLGRHLDRQEALARLDALMWSQPFAVDEVATLARRYRRAPGSRQLRELLPLVDGGAASAQESRIRLWLTDNGFPRAETQIPVLVGTRPVEFVSMGWPEFQVAVECGADAQDVKAIGRLRMLESLGWIVIRVTAEERPQEWLPRVEAALAGRGCGVEIDELQRIARISAA